MLQEYVQIQHLVAQRQVEGNRVRVRFACPQSGYSVESVGSLRKSNSMGQRLGDSVKGSFVNEARNMVSSTLGNVLGHGMMGRLARQATSEASRSVQGALRFSEEDVQRGVLAAFRSVQHSFRPDAQGRWMHASVAGGGGGLPGLGSFMGAQGSGAAGALGGLAGQGLGGLGNLLGGGGTAAGGLGQLLGGGGGAAAGGLGQLLGGGGASRRPGNTGWGAANALGSTAGGGGLGAAATGGLAGLVGGGLAGLLGGGLASMMGQRGAGPAQAAAQPPAQPAGQSGWSRIPGQQPPQQQAAWGQAASQPPAQPSGQSGWSRIPGEPQAGQPPPPPPPHPSGQSGWSRIPGQQPPQQQAPAQAAWGQPPPPASWGQPPAQAAWGQPPAQAPSMAGYGQPACGGQAEFDTVLRLHPPASDHDRNLLARLLVDLARVDGGFDAKENQHLAGLLPPEQLQRLVAQPPLSGPELAAVSAAARPGVAMLAYATAFADGRLQHAEKDLLRQLEAALQLPADQTAYLRKVARGAIIERLLQQIYADGHKSVDEAIELEKLAIELDIASERLRQLDSAFRQRRGMPGS